MCYIDIYHIYKKENVVYYTMKFNSAIKKNEIMLFGDKWMELKNIMFD
jgi:hypothetical protein